MKILHNTELSTLKEMLKIYGPHALLSYMHSIGEYNKRPVSRRSGEHLHFRTGTTQIMKVNNKKDIKIVFNDGTTVHSTIITKNNTEMAKSMFSLHMVHE